MSARKETAQIRKIIKKRCPTARARTTVLVLVGGFLLRYVVLIGGQMIF